MSKEELPNSLARLDSTVSRLENELIDVRCEIADIKGSFGEQPEQPEQQRLWRPITGNDYWFIDVAFDGTCIERQVWTGDQADQNHIDFGNVLPSAAIAEKQIPFRAKANKTISAAFQADPDAGEYTEERRHSAQKVSGKWSPELYVQSAQFSVVYVHTIEQAYEMARILNAEGVQ